MKTTVCLKQDMQSMSNDIQSIIHIYGKWCSQKQRKCQTVKFLSSLVNCFKQFYWPEPYLFSCIIIQMSLHISECGPLQSQSKIYENEECKRCVKCSSIIILYSFTTFLIV